MKKYFRNLNMLVILLAGFVIAGTCGNVLAGSPAPGFENGKPSGPSISGTLTYFFSDSDGDGFNDFSFTNATCQGESVGPFYYGHEFADADQISRDTLVGNGAIIPTSLLGDCIPPSLDPFAQVTTVFIRAVHSVEKTDAGNVTAEAVLLFLNE